MSLSRRFLATAAAAMVLVGLVPEAHALVLDPILPPLFIDFPPTVVASSPLHKERIVVDPIADNKRIIAVMFDSNVEFTSTPAAAISVQNLTTSTPLADIGISIRKNMLYFNSNQFTHPDSVGNSFQATVHANKIRKVGGGPALASDYVWQFKIANRVHVLAIPPWIPAMDESKAVVGLSKERFGTSATITFLSTSDQFATYRMRVINNGDYTIDSMVVKDVLPLGFTYDSLTFGTGIAVSGTRSLTFNIDGPLPPASTKVLDYRVKISGNATTVPNGTYDNSAIVMANFTPAGIGATDYDINTVSAPFFNDDSGEDITISHFTFIPPTLIPLPTTTASPSASPSASATPTASATPSPSLGFSHPSSDPLTCLQLSGATSINFSDVPSTLLQAPYVNFLTTTVFASDPTVRLSRGYSNGTFGTNNTLTRFELTKMALGANCMNYISSPSPNTFFSDVPTDNSEISLVIGKAYARGIVSGVGNQFYPNRPVSYGEMVKILVGAGVYFNHGSAVTSLSSTLSGISDESFRQFAEHAARMNLVDLGPSSTFPQNDQVQRRFMAQAVARYIAWLKNITLF